MIIIKIIIFDVSEMKLKYKMSHTSNFILVSKRITNIDRQHFINIFFFSISDVSTNHLARIVTAPRLLIPQYTAS